MHNLRRHAQLATVGVKVYSYFKVRLQEIGLRLGSVAAMSKRTISMSDLDAEREQTDLVRNRGQEGGLFRACMDKIRKKHHVGQLLRQAFVVMGVFTDKTCYVELLVQFYVVTKALERFVDKKELPKAMRAISYQFTELYEADLKFLLSIGDETELERRVNELTSDAAREYISLLQEECIHSNKKAAIAAGIIILWGPLIIGGGAALYPRVKNAYGIEATHVMEPILGPGREKRRNDFIGTIDELGSDESVNFDKVVEYTGLFMELNNKMMVAVKRRPAWVNYIYFAISAIVAVVAALYSLRYLK